MKSARNQFLSGPAFTLNQHVCLTGRNLANHLVDLLHGLAFADNIMEGVLFFKFLFEKTVFLHHPLLFNRFIDNCLESLHLERFGNEIGGSFFDRFHGCFNRSKRGD